MVLRPGLVLVIAAAVALGGVAVLAPPPAEAAPAGQLAYTQVEVAAGGDSQFGPSTVAVDQVHHVAFSSAPDGLALQETDTRTGAPAGRVELTPPGFDAVVGAMRVVPSLHELLVSVLGINTSAVEVVDTDTATVLRVQQGGSGYVVDETDHLVVGLTPSGLVASDLTTGALVGTFADDRGSPAPQSVAVDEASHTAVLSEQLGGPVFVDLRTFTALGRLDVGYWNGTVDVDQSTHTAYVTTNTRGQDTTGVGSVVAIDVASRTVLSTTPVGDGPTGLVVDQGNHQVLVALANGHVGLVTPDDTAARGSVAVLDGSTRQVVAKVEVGSGPQQVAVDATTHVAVVANRDRGGPGPTRPYGSISVLTPTGPRLASAVSLTTPLPVVGDDPTTFTAAVTPPTATGTVYFHQERGQLGGSCGGPVPVVAGLARCTVTFGDSHGYRDVLATYSGDAAVVPSVGWVGFTTVDPPSTTTMTLPTVATAGVPIPLTATVSPPPAADEQIAVLVDERAQDPCSSMTVWPGATTATCSVTIPDPGTHVVSVVRNRAQHLSDSRADTTVQVAPAGPPPAGPVLATTTSLTLPPTATVGVDVPMTVRVSPAPDPATTVTILEDGRVAGTCANPIVSAAAPGVTCPFRFGSAGPGTVTALFSATPTRAASQASVTVSVGSQPPPPPFTDLISQIVAFLVQLCRTYHLFGY